MYPVDAVEVVILDLTDDVNEYLKLGWQILNSYAYVPDPYFPNNTRLAYSMVWLRVKGDPVYP